MIITKQALQLAQRNVKPAFKFLLERNTNLSRTWKRPEALAHPKIWRRWTGRFKVADSTPVQFRIQDVPEELFETVVVHMAKGMRDEPMFSALGLWDDPASTRAMEELWMETLQQRVSLVALVDDTRYLRYLGTDNVIAGVNILGVVDKDSAHIVPKVEGSKAQLFLDALAAVERRVDVFARYGVSHYLTGIGLAVAREFRGLGVGTELVRGRINMGRAMGVPLTVTLFSNPASHAIAHTVGMEVLSDVPFDRLSVGGRVPFPGARGSMRLMAKRIE
ncbi:hypothetical protein R5R35_005445 [Gryllus longicercus]|uniref:N-acetyltransferase domain-containing protein n=1 Tax=Gryllus longicercus TaxID=2509291 RepID=A0AAN9ZE04_9ORTH